LGWVGRRFSEVAGGEGEEGPDESSADDGEGEIIVEGPDVCEHKKET